MSRTIFSLLNRARDVPFQLRHCTADILGSRLDVIRRRGAHVRVAKNALNHHVRHSQAIQVAPQAAPCCVPAVPLGKTAVPLVFVVGFPMVSFRFSAVFTAVQGRENGAIHDATQGERLAYSVGEDRATLRIAAAQFVHFQPFGQLSNYRNGRTALACLTAILDVAIEAPEIAKVTQCEVRSGLTIT